jgi:hypothetical protein
LDIEFIGHLYTRLRTTSDYSATAYQHTLQIITAHAKPQSFIAFASRCLVTALNNGDSSALLLLLATELIAPTVLVMFLHGPHRKHLVSKNNSIFAFVFFAAETCLPSRCPETVAVYRVTA